MELQTTFKEDLNKVSKYKSIVVGIEDFSINSDHIFTLSELEILINNAQLSNTKVNVLVNKMIFDSDLALLETVLNTLKTLDVDSIYFADMAVYMLAKKLNITNKLIYAPGMVVVNSKDVQQFLDLNIQGVELANELTLEEKIEIAKNNPNKCGIVISGYLLMSYSKRLALSNYFNLINYQKDPNNNFNYRLKEKSRDNFMPIYQDKNGVYIYSGYILDSFNFIKQLKDVPFKYFRIDGIFLDKALIDNLYQSYLMAILEDKNYSTYFKANYPQYTFNDTFYTNETSEVK